MRIHLRKRKSKLSEGKVAKGQKQMSSLYLAFQTPGKKVRYQWLELYLYESPKTNMEKEHNKETTKLAESIKAKRTLDFQTTKNGFVSAERGKIDFLQYFEKMVNQKKVGSEGNGGNWLSAFKHFKVYLNGDDYPIEQIDDRILEGFRDYLLNLTVSSEKRKLNINSAASYLNKVKSCLREAFMSKMIKENPCLRVKSIKQVQGHRQFLTLEELQKLASTPCKPPLLKKAFLFSALTGLRWSDVKEITWDKIHHSETDGWSIQFTQKKTKQTEVLPVAEQAIKLLGERTSDSPFEGLEYNAWKNIKLRDWIQSAGITKRITFHCARHSFATLQLSLNTDIYTVSKMLGHKNLRTTEIYAKVIDKRKIEAAGRMPVLMEV
jgi:integrase